METANQALLQSVRRLNTSEHLVGDQTCVIHSSLGVDTQVIGGAPLAESGWVYVYTDHPEAFSLLSLAAYLGIPEPLIEGAMKFVTVLKNGHQSAEVLPLVPSHADGLNLLSHSALPCVAKTAILYMPQGAGKTTHAQAVAQLLGCTNIIDDWNPNTTTITPGALHLTHMHMAMQGGAA